MPKPLVVLVPGLWIGASLWDEVVAQLHKHGYITYVAALASTGHRNDPNGVGPTFRDDVAAIRAVIESALSENPGREIMLVMHAGGGIIGGKAMEGLTKIARQKLNKTGGVTKLVYVAALLMYLGYDWPHFEFDEYGGMMCHNPRLLLFNDMNSVTAKKHIAKLQVQPGIGYAGVLKTGSSGGYYGWQDDGIQSTYLIATRDNIIDPKLQHRYAMEAGCAYSDEVSSGHMVPLSHPEAVAKFIRVTAGETELLFE